MKTTSLVGLAICLLLSTNACRFIGKGVKGSGVRKTEKRNLDSFKSIDATGAYETYVTCQQAQSFEIEGDDNILPIIKTEVRSGVLHIRSDGAYNSAKAIVIRIGVADLEKFSTSGADDAHIENVKNDQLVMSSNGAAKIEATGQTQFVDVTSNGAGHIDTSKLVAERAKVSLAGAGNVKVYASQQLDVTVSGIGNVTYFGNPPTVNKSVSGIGSVNKGGN